MRAFRAADVALVVPLVTQGELIGTLNLGPRLSEQEYSTDDRRLLSTLAAQAAPAIRVAQLVREQASEAAEKERLANRLQSLLDLLPGGVIVIDGQGVVREANPAARSLLGRTVTITALRGRMLQLADGTALFVTVHPSFLLRIEDDADKRREYDKLVADLRPAGRVLAKTRA